MSKSEECFSRSMTGCHCAGDMNVSDENEVKIGSCTATVTTAMKNADELVIEEERSDKVSENKANVENLEISSPKIDVMNVLVPETTNSLSNLKLSTTIIEDVVSIKNKTFDQKEKSTPSVSKQDIVHTNKDESTTITKLKQEIKERTEERDFYKQKLAEVEKRLADFESSIVGTITSDNNDEIIVRRTMEEFKKQLAQTTLELEDRGRIMANQENQINALNNQVSSLKEVVAVTKDLLEIRNMEVKHLQAEVDTMEIRICEERDRQNMMKNKIETAARFNADLKKEYETQLSLFQELRAKYKEKEQLYSEEKKALESATKSEIKKIN